MLTCGLINEEQATEIEARAAARDGWKRPPAHPGPWTELVLPLREALASTLQVVKPKRRR